jgi:hypothetical protein
VRKYLTIPLAGGLLLLAGALPAAAPASGHRGTKPVGWGPRTSRQAAKHVHRSAREPYHCWDACNIARNSTAFNADYYGGILRAYFDGKMEWLNTVERGREYRPGDLWGSVGAWFAGRWWTDPAKQYVHAVRERLHERTWRNPAF